MARDADCVVADEVDYVPNIDGNREDPDPFYVVLSPMTAAEVAALERGMGDFTGAKINFTDRAQKQVKEVFAERVKRVVGYSIRHHRTGDKIVPQNGAALHLAITEHGDEHEASIIEDVVKALKERSHLRAGLLETLRSQSGPTT